MGFKEMKKKKKKKKKRQERRTTERQADRRPTSTTATANGKAAASRLIVFVFVGATSLSCHLLQTISTNNPTISSHFFCTCLFLANEASELCGCNDNNNNEKKFRTKDSFRVDFSFSVPGCLRKRVVVVPWI